jgi:hypothetical protein
MGFSVFSVPSVVDLIFSHLPVPQNSLYSEFHRFNSAAKLIAIVSG